MADKLFTIGPVQMYDYTLNTRSKQIPYFRNTDFSNLMLENERLLKNLQYTEEDASVVFLTTSGTGAMEASVINLFDENDRVLIVSGGTFGKRFEEICTIHNIPFDVLTVNFDEDLTKEHFKKFNPKNYTGLLINIHETSIGKLYDIKVVKDFCRKGDILIVADIISSFLCDEFNMQKSGVDVAVLSSQKGLCLAPGMSFITVNAKAKDKIAKISKKTIYFDFVEYLTNMERGQTPFTPAVGICYELNDMLKHIDEKGISNRIFSCAFNARYFRELLKETGASCPNFNKSNALTMVMLKKPNAKKIMDRLKSKHGIIVNPSSGEFANNSFRVSHTGNIESNDYKTIIDVIKKFSK